MPIVQGSETAPIQSQLYKVFGTFVFASSWLGRTVCSLLGSEVTKESIRKIEDVEHKIMPLIVAMHENKDTQEVQRHASVLTTLLSSSIEKGPRSDPLGELGSMVACVAQGLHAQSPDQRQGVQFRVRMRVLQSALQRAGNELVAAKNTTDAKQIKRAQEALDKNLARTKKVLTEVLAWNGEQEWREVKILNAPSISAKSLSPFTSDAPSVIKDVSSNQPLVEPENFASLPKAEQEVGRILLRGGIICHGKLFQDLDIKIWKAFKNELFSRGFTDSAEQKEALLYGTITDSMAVGESMYEGYNNLVSSLGLYVSFGSDKVSPQDVQSRFDFGAPVTSRLAIVKESQNALEIERRIVSPGPLGHENEYRICMQKSVLQKNKSGQVEHHTYELVQNRPKLEYLLEEYDRVQKEGSEAEKEREAIIVQKELLPLLFQKRKEGKSQELASICANRPDLPNPNSLDFRLGYGNPLRSATVAESEEDRDVYRPPLEL